MILKEEKNRYNGKLHILKILGIILSLTMIPSQKHFLSFQNISIFLKIFLKLVLFSG